MNDSELIWSRYALNTSSFVRDVHFGLIQWNDIKITFGEWIDKFKWCEILETTRATTSVLCQQINAQDGEIV